MTTRMPSAYGRHRREDGEDKAQRVTWEGRGGGEHGLSQSRQDAAVTPPPPGAAQKYVHVHGRTSRSGFPIMWPRSSRMQDGIEKRKRGGCVGGWSCRTGQDLGVLEKGKGWACLETKTTCLPRTTRNTDAHIYVHACSRVHGLYMDTNYPRTCVSRIPHGREDRGEGETDRQSVSHHQGRARRRTDAEQTGRKHRSPLFGSAASNAYLACGARPHTILSQSSGLWEAPGQLIGFAGRLGFGGVGLVWFGLAGGKAKEGVGCYVAQSHCFPTLLCYATTMCVWSFFSLSLSSPFYSWRCFVHHARPSVLPSIPLPCECVVSRTTRLARP